MGKFVETVGKDVQEAVDNALKELGVDLDEVNVDILCQGGIFKNAKVRVELLESSKIDDDKSENEQVEDKIVAEQKESTECQNCEQSQFKTYSANFLSKTLLNYRSGITITEREQNKVFVLTINGEGTERFGNKEVVDAFQTLLNAIEREHNKSNEKRIVVNVGDYEQKRSELLYQEATKCADQAIAEGRTIRMKPMNSYERHLIHDFLQNRPEIIAESFGVEPYRYLTIRPNDK